MHNEIVNEFLHTHPDECAREIEHFSLDDILFFLKSLSKNEKALIIASLIPSIAAVCLQNLSLEESKSIVLILPLDALKKIFPRIHEQLRLVLVAALPKNQRIALQYALSFSSQTVGAFMNTHVLFLPVEHNVAQALTFIHKFSDEITPWIFCIDKHGELQGMVTLKDIITTAHGQIIGHIMHECPVVLAVSTNIQSIALNEIWKTQSVLPVVDEHRVLLGVLEYHQIVTHIQNALFGEPKEVHLFDSLSHIMFMFSHTTEDILTEISQLTSSHKREK